jgi:hypothetical protein
MRLACAGQQRAERYGVRLRKPSALRRNASRRPLVASAAPVELDREVYVGIKRRFRQAYWGGKATAGGSGDAPDPVERSAVSSAPAHRRLLDALAAETWYRTRTPTRRSPASRLS